MEALSSVRLKGSLLSSARLMEDASPAPDSCYIMPSARLKASQRQAHAFLHASAPGSCLSSCSSARLKEGGMLQREAQGNIPPFVFPFNFVSSF